MLTNYRQENGHFCLFYFNMDKLINLPSQKNPENELLSNKSNHYFTYSNIGIQIYDIQQSILKKCPAF